MGYKLKCGSLTESGTCLYTCKPLANNSALLDFKGYLDLLPIVDKPLVQFDLSPPLSEVFDRLYPRQDIALTDDLFWTLNLCLS